MSKDQRKLSGTRAVRLRAKYLVQQNHELIASLVQIRKDSGLTQADVAEMLGITQQSVSEFERMLAPASLNRIANYAHAVGAIVSHHVVKDAGQLLPSTEVQDRKDHGTSESKDSDGANTKQTAPAA